VTPADGSDPVTESGRQSVTGSAGGPDAESPRQSVTGSAGGPVTDSPGQSVTGSAGGPVTDSPGQSVKGSAGGPVTAAAGDRGLCGLLGLDRARVGDLIARLAERGITLAAAESLTGGLFTAALTEIPGSSAVVRGGIVCYATDLKRDLVGVDADLLAERGPVDREVALQLATGVRDRCRAGIGVGLTGVAGPGPQDGVPAGTVFVAASSGSRTGWSALTGDDVDPSDPAGAGGPDGRWRVRAAAVRAAVQLVEDLLA
jgi:nicotinamide-nucleotide amidase